MAPSDKLCMVCNDKALGYNFNAITCESCKAFFRRNALSNKEFTCPFSGNCEISVVTRRFCQKCRLEKCFTVGMRKDYIMSEEDKMLKRIKMENNRTKRKSSSGESSSSKMKREDSDGNYGTSSSDGGFGGNSTHELIYDDQDSSPDFGSPKSVPSTSGVYTSKEDGGMYSEISSSRSPDKPVQFPTNQSAPGDIVDRLIDHPEDASKLINTLMQTPEEAVEVLTKILNSQKDAMRFIGHLIGSPGDALKIISKIMNSPFDALTVFTKFMSSPTDSLEIISKIASSPGEVLQFVQQLMNSPEDAIEIMNKFMNSPAEALKLLNKMVNIPAADSTTQIKDEMKENLTDYSDRIMKENPMIKSMLEMHFQDDRIRWPVSATHSRVTSQTTAPPTCQPLKTSSECDQQETFVGTSNSVHEVLQDVNSKPIQPNSLEDVICEAIKLEYDASVFFTPGAPQSKDLNDAERAKLNELIVANKALYAPLDDDVSGLDECIIKANQNSQDPQLLKIINLTATAIRRLIKMSKKINAFKNMCQEDQVALLKGGCTEMMILRSVIQYDVDHAKWKIPHSQETMSSISAEVLKLAKGNVFEEHEKFIRSFEGKWRKDENIILVMCAIVLFTPNRPRAIHTDVIKLEQNSYYYLLRRYLESVYTGCEAKSTFLKLIKKIGELQRVSDVIIGVYLDVNPSQVEPLLREIFDMKNH